MQFNSDVKKRKCFVPIGMQFNSDVKEKICFV